MAGAGVSRKGATPQRRVGVALDGLGADKVDRNGIYGPLQEMDGASRLFNKF
jgi:hypothetical protein